MITPGDEYPLHQTSRPVRDPGSDRNAYDRFFFNGYDRDGEAFFAVALGLYPGRNVMDAALGVVVDGVQHNVRASRLLGADRLDTRVGPVAVEILEPLRRLAVRVDDPESGLHADLTFSARGPVFEEPHYRWQPGHRVLFDVTRMTQNGTWSGTLRAGGRTFALDDDSWWGTRDRSWGTRPVGEREAPGAPDAPPGFYWLWAPLNFDDACVLFDVNEHPDGRRWHESALWAPAGAAAVAAGAVEAGAAAYSLAFRSGTRHAEAAELALSLPSGERRIALSPRLNFYMQGLGYGHPTESHGVWLGEDFRRSESFATAEVDETALHNQHVQALCRAERDDGAVGVGVLEQLVVGPHAPSGFADLLDPAP